MALTATADLIMSAAVNGAAVPAFNAITLEHAEGIAAGVERSGAAALIQISEKEWLPTFVKGYGIVLQIVEDESGSGPV